MRSKHKKYYRRKQNFRKHLYRHILIKFYIIVFEKIHFNIHIDTIDEYILNFSEFPSFIMIITIKNH